ncbi:unnamed protein product [Symbiodinium sp. CCMP2456]|nr:unnamed protein product [Symbiodinium sp. CCMP2456]
MSHKMDGQADQCARAEGALLCSLLAARKKRPAKEESLEKEEKQPETSDDAQPEPDDSVQLSGFTGGSASLNGTFVPDGNTVNGKQVYSQSQGDAGLECMWYHNGAWRIGSYNWFNSKELGRCHAYVKTSAQDLGDIAPSETWMSCMGTAGGDPDVDKGLFQPQMSAKAAKLALDSLTRRSTSKKTSQVPVGGSTRLENILADQSWRHDFELRPMTPPSKERAQWRSQGSEEVANSEAADLPEQSGNAQAVRCWAVGDIMPSFERIGLREGGHQFLAQTVMLLSSIAVCVSLSALFHLNGSVFPFATKVALPCALVAFLFKYGDVHEWPVLTDILSHTEMDATVYNAFSTLLGILVVFRTGQAYDRFWDGSTLTHQMRGDWFDAASSIISFTRTSKADAKKLWEFRQIVVRLFSMLHALSLAELEDDDDEDDDRWAHRLRLIDGTGIDVTSLKALKKAECKVELVFHWIQSIVVCSIDCGIMSAPSPILTRAYSELASGMVKFHDCLKIARIAVPFPYSQATLMLLVIHWIVTPFVMVLGTQTPAVSCVITFITVFILWSLHSIAIELENPFGADANDLDVHDMQHDMNNRLLLLLDPISAQLPRLSGQHVQDHECLLDMERERVMPAFDALWKNLATEVEQGADIKRGRRSLVQLRRGSFVAKKSSSQVSLTEYQKRVQDVLSSPENAKKPQWPGIVGRILSSGSKRTGSREGSRTGSDASLPTHAKVASKSTLSPSSVSGTEVMVDCLSSGQLESVMESDAEHDQACGPVASNSLSRPSSRGNFRSEGSSPRKATKWQVPLDSALEDSEGQGRSAVLQQPQACEQHLHIALHH